MPAGPGNCYLNFTWDGSSYSLPFVNVSSYECKPIYAEDNQTIIRQEITISGTSVLTKELILNLGSVVRSRFDDGAGKIDSFSLSMDQGGVEIIESGTRPDAMNGPFMSISVTDLNARQSALVSFTIQHSRVSTDISSLTPNYPIISNRWTTSYTLDAAGVVTRTVRGTLICNLGSGGSSTGVADDATYAEINGKRPWADLFRRSVLPITTGIGYWRRESQTFAYNEEGNGLIYEIVDKQARTNLPDAAFTGNMEFTYERRTKNAFVDFRISVDLEGQVDGDVRSLIDSAVSLAGSRIVDYKKCWIQRLTVTEREMLGKASIRLEMDTLVPCADPDNPATTQYAVPLANQIGRYFSVSRSCAWQADPYGAPTNGEYAYPHWYDNLRSAKYLSATVGTPLAVAEQIAVLAAGCPVGTPTITFLGDTTDFTTANSTIQAGGASQPLAQTTAAGQVDTVERQVTVTTAKTQTRMHRVQTLYTQGADFVFQVGKPAVILEEATTVRRIGSPPSRVFRPIPAGFLVVNDDWKVNHGDVDASGHRVYTGVYTRSLMAYDGGGATSNGYSTVSGRRQWWSPTNSVGAPYTLGFDATDQQSTTSALNLGAASFAYQLGTAQDYA